MSAQCVKFSGRRLRSLALAGAAFAVAQAAATPASAGLLEALFGFSQPRAVLAPPPAPAAAAPRPQRPRIVRDRPAGPRKYVAPEVGAGPAGRFVHDKTLRRGDIVATANGLMIFQGKGGANGHRAADFVPVQKASTGARRSDLLALDRSIRNTTPNVEFVALAPEPKELVIAKRPDMEIRGGFIVQASDRPALTEGAVAAR